MGDPDVWPLMLDISRDESKRILRRLELEAYSNLVSVLRAQGSLTPQKRRLLQNVAQTLSISEERHKAECRRAVNSEKLATIAKHMGGVNSGTEWAIEGRRLVPLLPRLVPQTAFTAIADKVANMAMTEGAKLPLPTPPAKKRLSSPPIDETLLEPNVPEASKTPQISSGSPLSVNISMSESHQYHQSGKPFSPSPLESPQSGPNNSNQSIPTELQLSGDPVRSPSPSPTSLSSVLNASQSVPFKQEVTIGLSSQVPQPSVMPPVSSSPSVPSSQTLHQQTVQKSQVVLLVRKEDKLQEERLARKRPRSASLDMSLNISPQGQMMPPPLKKEATSPSSPVSMASPLSVASPFSHLPSTISPQSHSQLVQQQTLQAAAAAVAAATSSAPVTTSLQPQHLGPPPQLPPLLPSLPQQQPPLSLPVTLQPAVPLQQQQLQQQPPQQPHLHPSTPSAQFQTNTPAPIPSARTITIPTQGTVKLSLSSSTPTSVSGIPTGTHKVIIVSSTTPSILQRSLSVPVVKSLSTSAPSQPSSSTLVLNTVHQTQQATSSSATGSSDTSTSTSPHTVLTTLPGKVPAKIINQSTPKSRPRANSIVIPVTPNQTNVMNSVGVTSAQLKSALQAGKQAVLKSGETTGLKIMPLANVASNSKLLPKASGSGSMYVVGTTSTASPTVSMVARTVSSGQRVMTFTSSLPKVAISSSQGGNVLSMTSKPVQTLQLAQPGSVVTSSGTMTFSSTAGKPNVIVVQKGSTTAFSRGLTLTHGGKEIVGKVLLGGKSLSSLNPSQIQNPVHTQAVPSSSQKQNSNSPSPHSQTVPMQTSLSSTAPQLLQSSVPTTVSAPTRVVTVQKMPSAVVQGSSGSSNVIVLDLSQEQLNNSAVLNEILASSILQSSNIMNFNHGAISDLSSSSINALKGLLNFSSEQNDTDSGMLGDGNILVEGFNQSIGSHCDTSMEGNLTDFSSDIAGSIEGSHDFVLDDGSANGGQSSHGNTNQSARIQTDICATAMSNANLNLNDLLDSNSLDEIQSLSLDGMKMEIATEAESVAENSSIHSHDDASVGTWVPSGDTLTQDEQDFP